MAFVKIYNNQHAQDLGLNQTWTTTLGWKVGCKNTPSRGQIEGYLKRLGEECNNTVGVKINPKSVEFLYRKGDVEAEYSARIACDKLLKAVNRSWTAFGRDNDPIVPELSQCRALV